MDVDEHDRVTNFVEKPADPPTTLCATATYLYRRDHAALVSTYLAEGNPPDQPGNFVAWLHKRVPVYAYRFPGEWYDIGDQRSCSRRTTACGAARACPSAQSIHRADTDT